MLRELLENMREKVAPETPDVALGDFEAGLAKLEPFPQSKLNFYMLLPSKLIALSGPNMDDVIRFCVEAMAEYESTPLGE